MSSNIIPHYFGNLPTNKSGKGSVENSDPYAAFAALLRQSIEREKSDGSSPAPTELDGLGATPNVYERPFEITLDLDNPTLNLLEGTTDFDSLGVLILRALNQAHEALAYSEQSELTSNPDPDLILLNKQKDGVSNPAGIDNDGLFISSSTKSEINHSLSSIAVKPQLSAAKFSTAKIVASSTQEVRSLAIPSLISQRVALPSSIDAENVKFSTINLVEDAADAQNSEIEVNIIRGELGLIVQVATSSIPARLLKALEQRLTRLVEQSGEKVERFEFRSLNVDAEDPIFRVLERATNGSD